MRTHYMKKSLTILLALVVFLAFTMAATVEANAASSTKTMTVYDSVIKKGNTVYCATTVGVYKAKLKNKKVVSKKRLAEAYYGTESMKLKGGYLYYCRPYPVGNALYRVNLKTGKNEAVFAPGEGRFKNYDSVSVEAYAFKGNKLYARIAYESLDSEKAYEKTFVAKLNGKSSKVTKVKVSNKERTTNKKGYKIVNLYSDNWSNANCKSYLRTPKGRFYLGKGYVD